MKKRIALLLALVLFCSYLATPASAATCSLGTKTRTITVVTKANWWYPGSESITISQSKGTFAYDKTNIWGRPTGETGTKRAYGDWKIQLTATDGSHSDEKYLRDGSITLKLKPDKTYKITISFDSLSNTFTGLNYRNMRWTTYPSWRVSGTWKVSSYY